jgi:oxygen-independent coproporphyrinogen-3 oxidase
MVRSVPLGLYISVPFCRTKCSYCNFASDVFSKSAYESYVGRLLEDIGNARHFAAELGFGLGSSAGGSWGAAVDSVYLGGGTPSILDAAQLLRVFAALRHEFGVTTDAEITVECAPGTLTPALVETLLQCGVNRVSLGVQSFVDQEAQSVGRLHNRSTVLEEIARLRQAGLENISIDLIAGLPHQTAESWAFSVSETIATGVPHVSVYMLEVDEDSRLGREVIAGGARYHAHFVPDDDATADLYQQACEMLGAAGIAQYEISNFARAALHSQSGEVQNGKSQNGKLQSYQSRHNLKYWTRQPYLGFGVDAHSMLDWSAWGRTHSSVPAEQSSATAGNPDNTGFATAIDRAEANHCQAVRFAAPDSLDGYMNRVDRTLTPVSLQAAIEEAFFLGLRLNRGVDLAGLQREFGPDAIASRESAIRQSVQEGLLEQHGMVLRLTNRGRVLSNEVFARFLREDAEEVEETKVGTGHVNPR